MILDYVLSKDIINNIKKNIINNIEEHYPQHFLINDIDLINNIKKTILPLFNLEPEDYYYYYDFVVIIDKNKTKLGWHTDSSDTILNNYNDIFNIGINLKVDETDETIENKSISGIKYIDPLKNKFFYKKISDNLERSIYLLENKERNDFIINNNLFCKDTDIIIKDFKNNYIIYNGNDLIIDCFESFNINNCILFNSSMFHKTHEEINTNRLTIYIKFCNKNYLIKDNIDMLYIPEWKITSRLSAYILKYGNNFEIKNYIKFTKILRHFVYNSNSFVAYPNIENINNDSINLENKIYISTLEGNIIEINKNIIDLFVLIKLRLEDKELPIQEYSKSYFNNDISELKIINKNNIYLPIRIRYNVFIKIIELINENNFSNINNNLDINWYFKNTDVNIIELIISLNYIGYEDLFKYCCNILYNLIVNENIENIFKKNIRINLIQSSTGKGYPYLLIKKILENNINKIII
jgi:hypothetical protein